MIMLFVKSVIEILLLTVALVMRSVYKDFVLLLQEDRLLGNNERKKKVNLLVTRYFISSISLS